MLAVLVSLDDPGLMIFPTHRVFEREPAERLPGRGAARRSDARPRRSSSVPADRAAARRSTGDGDFELAVDGNELDVRLVDRLGHEGISYTPDWDEAVRAVDSGEAEVAVLMRPTRIEDVFAVAQRGETMPQKSTYFYPKLVSGPAVPARCDRLAGGLPRRRSRTSAACSSSCRRATSASRSSATARAATRRPRSTRRPRR